MALHQEGNELFRRWSAGDSSSDVSECASAGAADSGVYSNHRMASAPRNKVQEYEEERAARQLLITASELYTEAAALCVYSMPLHAVLLSNASQCFLSLGFWDLARAAAKQALKLDPDSEKSKRRLAKAKKGSREETGNGFNHAVGTRTLSGLSVGDPGVD